MTPKKPPPDAIVPPADERRPAPPFSEEIDAVDETRSDAENETIDRQDAEAVDEADSLLDPVHRLTR